jgi:hypothetical protein
MLDYCDRYHNSRFGSGFSSGRFTPREGYPMDRENDKDTAALDEMIEQITTDAYTDDEKLWAFRQAFEDDVSPPADGFVIGEPVVVVEIDYDGNERRGLTARCRREDGSEHRVAASDVVFPEGSSGARLVAAYRRWLGIAPCPAGMAAPSRRKRRHKVTAEDLDLGKTVDLAVLSVKERAARCQLLGSDRIITFRSSRIWDLAPGEIVTVRPRKQWGYAGHPYLSGEVESKRIDAAALGLAPLRLEETGIWDPGKHYWGEKDEPIEDWAKPIIARGPRPEFKMEQVLHGADPADPFSDPITESNSLGEAGDLRGTRRILMELCEADLRCLDAHAHLGALVFDSSPKEAVRHYEVGLRIGELSLGDRFDGLLPWGPVDNRPFLRCLYGYALCLWRMGRFDEAGHSFDRMLWLNPYDNQGVRSLIEAVGARTAWEKIVAR